MDPGRPASGRPASRARAGARARGRDRRAAARAGRVRLWIPLALLFWAGMWISRGLEGQVTAAGLTTVDARRSALSAPGFCDGRWHDELAARLARVGAVRALDREGVERIASEVRALPFVAEVGAPSVRWPDGVELPVRLRVPAACVKAGETFLAVSTDGVILPGPHAAPPRIEGEYLPVIGPNDGAFAESRPGERLAEPRHLDALEVAVSMREALTAEQFGVLGPPLIDATRARAASVSEPGVVIKLEARRLVLFGRPPNAHEPGELPQEFKWAALGRALEDLAGGDPALDWSTLDVRWDVPVIERRGPPAEPPERPESAGERAR